MIKKSHKDSLMEAYFRWVLISYIEIRTRIETPCADMPFDEPMILFCGHVRVL